MGLLLCSCDTRTPLDYAQCAAPHNLRQSHMRVPVSEYEQKYHYISTTTVCSSVRPAASTTLLLPVSVIIWSFRAFLYCGRKWARHKRARFRPRLLFLMACFRPIPIQPSGSSIVSRKRPFSEPKSGFLFRAGKKVSRKRVCEPITPLIPPQDTPIPGSTQQYHTTAPALAWLLSLLLLLWLRPPAACIVRWWQRAVSMSIANNGYACCILAALG